MRVVVLDHSPVAGGAELALMRLLPALAGRPVDARVVVFGEGPFARLLRARGIPCEIVPLAPSIRDAGRETGALTTARSLRALLPFVRALLGAVRRAHPDLVVANTLKSALAASLVAPLVRRPWVWHLHDRLAHDYLPRSRVLALRALAVVGPAALVVNSRATLATLPRRARRKAVVAYPGLEPDAWTPGAPPPGPATVGLIGRISPTKGQREFVRAAARVAAERPEVGFRVVGAALYGEDDYVAEVRALAESLDIADRVDFAGWSDDPGGELRRLAVLVHASPVPEPFGQIVAEALAAGVPVIGTDAGGVREILGAQGGADAEAGDGWRGTSIGWLVRPGDPAALAAAIGAALDAVGDEAHAERGRAASRRFSVAATADAVWSAWTRAARRVG